MACIRARVGAHVRAHVGAHVRAHVGAQVGAHVGLGGATIVLVVIHVGILDIMNYALTRFQTCSSSGKRDILVQ